MQQINSTTNLRDAILKLESAQAQEGKILKEQFQLAYESVKPINLIKNTFKEVTASQSLKENLLNTAVGITAGYLSKKLVEGTSDSPFKKLLGTALMFGITNAVAKNPDAVKAAAKGLFIIIHQLKTKHVECARQAQSNT
jgi:hypothetical protein